MPYRPVSFRGFGSGLNLRDAPDVLDESQALDCLNVVFTERGAVRQREGYAQFTASTLTTRGASLEPYYETGGTTQLLVGAGTRLEALSTAGAVVDSEIGLTDAVWDFARVGTPNAETAYAGNGTDTFRKWDGATWTAPTVTTYTSPTDGTGTAAQTAPKAGLLAVDATSNRLVVSGFSTTTGGPGGAVSSPSHVYWSRAGEPEGWENSSTVGNFVQLTPGDGERIMAVVAFRELIIVFKQSKFFTFWGESSNASGGAVFNYDPVETGVGLASSRAYAVTPEGVYFMDRTGVYITTGGPPKRVSDPIEPIFLGNPNAYFKSDPLNHDSITDCAMGWWNDRLYLAYPSGSATANDRTLVFDPQAGWWSLWDVPAAALARFRVDDVEELVFAYASGDNHVGRHNGRDRLYTADNMAPAVTGGTAISARWRSGWFDYANPAVKRIRESKFWGVGSGNVRVYTDYKDSAQATSFSFSAGTDLFADGTDSSDLFADGTDPTDLFAGPVQILPQLIRRAHRGTLFSTEIRNETLNATFAIHRLEHHLADEKIPSTKDTE